MNGKPSSGPDGEVVGTYTAKGENGAGAADPGGGGKDDKGEKKDEATPMVGMLEMVSVRHVESSRKVKFIVSSRSCAKKI